MNITPLLLVSVHSVLLTCLWHGILAGDSMRHACYPTHWQEKLSPYLLLCLLSPSLFMPTPALFCHAYTYETCFGWVGKRKEDLDLDRTGRDRTEERMGDMTGMGILGKT